jgi:methylated-DNA-protein-cysteine methyltransferase-like protein
VSAVPALRAAQEAQRSACQPSGARVRYTTPPNRQEYHARVWQLAREIPRGKVATYGQLALMLAPPEGVDAAAYGAFGPRWVGGAMAACPDDVPWQRVINSQGKISRRPGSDKQRELLEAEGVIFSGDRVDLNRYGWEGQSASDGPRTTRMF